MRGGTIRDNEAGTGGGVHVYGGTFTMEDGIISGNKAGGYGGGVAVNKSTTITGGTITMTGGTIRDNEASFGGGVHIDDDNCTFTKTGGTIYGDTDNTHTPGGNENTATSGHPGNGHAVLYYYSKYRDSTLNTGDNISTGDLSSPPWDR
jgi:hypothetical protein